MLLYLSADGCLGNAKHSDDSKPAVDPRQIKLFSSAVRLCWYFSPADVTVCAINKLLSLSLSELEIHPQLLCFYLLAS